MTVGTKVAAIVMGGLHFVANLATRPAPQLGCPGGLRMRVLLLAPLVLCVATRAAWATGQVPERIVVNGQLHELYSTPLAPLLERREDLEGSFPSWSTGCWRGYVGSWQVIGDRLELVLAQLGLPDAQRPLPLGDRPRGIKAERRSGELSQIPEGQRAMSQ